MTDTTHLGGSTRAALRRAWSLLLVVAMTLGLVTATSSAVLADDVDVSDTVDSAGQAFRSYDFTAATDGTVAASLGWPGAADLALYVRRVDDEGANPVGPLLSVSKTSVQPEQFSFDVVGGETYRLIVEAISGSATYDLEAILQSGATRTFLGTADLPANAVYRAHPITVASPGMMVAELTWDDPGADLGLYLRGDDGSVVDVSRSDAPSERLSVELDAAGSYEYLVRAKSGATPYTLDVAAVQTGEPRSIISSIGYQGSNGGTQVYDAYDITSSQAGTLVATLDSGDPAANLDVFARPVDGATLGPIAVSSATSVDTEQLSLDVDAGDTVRLLVKATSGAAPFTLSTDLETGTERTYRFTSDPGSQNWRTIPFAVAGPGALGATLTGDGAADLQLYLRRPDGSLGEVLKTDAQPEVFTHDAAVAGGYELIATSASGASAWTLETRFQDTFERELIGQVGFTSSTGVQAFESYDVTAPSDGLAVVRVAPTDGDADLNLYARRIDDPNAATPGPLLATSVTGADPEAMSFPVVTGESYRIYVEAETGASHFAAQVELDTAERPTLVGTVDIDGQRYRSFDVELETGGELSASLAWADASNLALFLQETDGTTIASAATGDNPETLSATVPAGTYRLTVRSDAGATAFELDTTFEAAENVAPLIVVDDSASATETIEIDPITVEVTDPEDEPTVTVDGLPAGLSYDDADGEITGAPEPGTAAGSPYTVVVTADDGVNDAVTAELELTVAAAPVEACGPLSPNPCDTLPVATPFALDFSGDEGGLGDADGDDLGFTLVDAPSNRDGTDQAPAPATPSDPDVPGFEPSLLDVAGGNLTITATKGINYAQVTSDDGTVTSTETNTQLNALGVAVPAGGDLYELTTTVVAPDYGDFGSSQQGGLLWFVDEDTYVKAVVSRVNNGNNRVQLAVESLDAPTADDADGFLELNSPNIAVGQDVALRLEIDAANGEARLFYSVDGGAEQQLVDGGDDELLLPAALVDGVDLEGSDHVFAGLFATKRRAPAGNTVTATFADFGVTAPSVAPALVADPTSLAFTVGADTAAATVDVTSDGDDVDVSVINDQPWLTAALADGATSTPATIEVTVDPDGLAPGDYTGNVTVLSPAADDVVVPVDLTVEDTPPTIAPIDDLEAVEGDAITAITVEVEDPNGTPTVTVDGLPAGLSYDDGTGEITGAPDVGTADGSPFSVTVTADDGVNDAVTEDFQVTVTAPAEPCSPVSPQPCDTLPVATPFALDFSGDEGGLGDADGDDLGFTLVDAPSERDGVDQAPAPATPSDPDVPGFEPSLLDVAGGNLTITATKGIQFAQPTSDDGTTTSSETNSQLNGLGVAIATGADTHELTTTLVAPEFGSSNSFQQGGLWWFVDEDTYVKLAVQRQSGTENKVQLAVESLGAPTSDDPSGFAELSSANIPDGQDVALRLEVDAADGVVRGFYTVADGTEVQVAAGGSDQLVLPDALVDGVAIDGEGSFANAGIFATKRRATAASSMTATFADFGVTAPTVVAPTLSADPTSLDLTASTDTATASFDVSSDGDDVDVSVVNDQPWITAVLRGGASSTPATVDVTVDPDGLTPGDYTGTVTVLSPDADDLVVPVGLTVEAPEACSPVSPLPCGDLTVATPFALDFSGDEGGLGDAQGDDLGFTLVDAPSNRDGTDQDPAPATPSDPDVPGFEPSLLDVAGGNLTITATKGINYAQLPADADAGEVSSTETNTQLNGLGVAVPTGEDAYELNTTVVAPDFAGGNDSQQAGLWWFVSEDVYAKLVVARSNASSNSVELAVESLDAPTTDDADGFASFRGATFADTQDVALRMEVDAADGVVRGYATVADGAEELIGELVLPDALVDGVDLGGEGAVVNAGVFASKRRAPAGTDVTATFADFGVTSSEAPVEDVALSVNFQSEEAAVPAGHVRDFGEAFGPRTGADQGTGLTYGWVEQADVSQPQDMLEEGRDRGSNPDQRFDTLVHLQRPGPNGAPPPKEGAWQLEVPNGTYDVTVAVGDPNNGGDPESHTINVEGVNAIDGFPKSSAPNGDPARHTTATVTVTVADGQLTIDAIGGENTKLNFVEVTTNDGTIGDDPVFLAVADRTVTEGQDVLVPAGASDPDGGVVTIALTDGPAWLSWDAADGRVEGTVPTDAGGTTVTVELTATDDEGATAVEAFDLTIEVALDLAINFQPAGAALPAGFLRDSGDGFAERTGADQGSGLSYGWVTTADATPLDLTGNTRDRDRSPGVDQLDDTIIHTQYGDTGGTNGETTEGAWEIALPEGGYRVTVTVGDQPGAGGVYDSTHVVNAEDGVLVESFQSTGAEEYATFTGDVGVVDGRLTLSPVGGTNTKLTHVEITSLGQLPFVTVPIPANRSDGALLDTNVSGAVSVPGAGVGVDPSDTSLNAATVKLFEVVDGGADVEVAATRGSTGGNDTISVAPDEPLKAFTTYRFVVDGALDENGYTFLPFTSLFTTGEDDSTGGGGGEFEPVTGVDFEKVDLGIDDLFFSSLVVHEGYLWATTIGQGTYRYEILPDGTLGPELNLNLFDGRAAIGFVFDESDPTVAWFTHATANTSSESQEFGSKVSRVDFGTDLDSEAQVTNPTVDDVFVNLPRSLKDHLSNSMAYGPSGDADNRWMYFLQGSNQAAGDVDSSWGLRTETVLTAAVLRFDPVESWADVQANGPIDVQTEDGGTYDPFAAGAPLEVYATGIRNAYDLVFHSNGSLYVPTNGTAGGGTSANSPGVDIDGGTSTMTTNYNPGGNNEDAGRDLTDICLNDRIDGQPYSGGEVPPASHQTQRDFLFEVEEGGYYGHPNPERCEFVLNNGGDPVFDGQDGTGYDASVSPDPNYRGFAYNFEFNKSPNGAIEYQSNTFDGALQGRLMVVRFSGNNDILTMQVDTDGTVLGAQPGTDIGGFAANYLDPLDVTEDTTVNEGNLYLNQFARGQNGAQKLFLLRVPSGQQAGAISVDPEAARLSATLNGEQPTDTTTVEVTNDGSEPVDLSDELTGDDAADFSVAVADTSLAAGASTTVTITFDPTGTTTGTRTATLEVSAGDDTETVALRALAFQGQFGGEEPTLQQVTDTLELGIDTGWTGLAGGTNPAAQGDEVLEPLFERASAGPVTMTPVAAFAPFEALPFGWYVDDGNGGATLNEVGVMASGQQQTLDPTLSSGGVSFDPGTDVFGTYYFSNTFSRTGYTEDARNDGAGGVFHRARVYPLSGDRFLVAFEDASNGDYQDYVFVLDNVVAADGDGGGGSPTGDAIKVNFQAETAPVPADHVRDFGEAYGERTGADQGDGLSYGWVDDETFDPLSLVGNGRDRGLNDDQRLDTLMHMDLPPDNNGGTLADGSWELAVEDGTYDVTVSVGDPANGQAPETHVVNVEGVSAIAGFPKSGAADGSDARHSQATVTVEVLDGNLTIDQTGGTNTKINYVEITPQDGGGGDGEVVAQVNFQTDDATTPAGWEADTGELFTAGRGYGWVRTEGGADKTDDTRNRGGDPDPLTATTIIVDDDTVDAVVDGEWELAVADATYTVEVSVGDAGFGDSTHTVLAEGETVVDGFVPTGAGDYATGSATVEVSDGRLTVASGGGNTKLQWIRVTSDDGVDTVPPRVELEVTGDQLGDAYVDEATVSATVTDATLEFNEYVLDGGTSTAYTEPVVVTGVGEHTFELTATDGAGNTTVESVTFDIVELTTTDGELTLTNPEAAPFDDRLVMSRIQSTNSSPKFNDTASVVIGNDGTEAFDIVSLDVDPAGGGTAGFEVTAPTTLPVTVPVGGSVTIEVLMTAVGTGQNQIFESDLRIGHEASNGPETLVELAGMWQTQSEGGNEPNVAEIVETFGFGTTIVEPGQQINNQGRLETIGDEVLSQYWERANTGEPVTVRQLAAYHSCCNNTASFRWHVEGQKDNQTVVLVHDGEWAQSLLPRINGSDTAPALTTFTPSEQRFGLRIDPESSDWELNNTGPDQCGAGNAGCQLGHHLRVWPAEDRDGVQVPNLWIVVMDYSGINYDFNDNVYLVSNITPAGTADTTPPAAPEGLTATGGDPDVTLDWADNTEDDLAGTFVERSTGGAFSRLNSTPLTVSAYTDTTAPAGTTVTYRVVAVDDAGNESDPSTTASIDTEGTNQPQPIRINAGGPAVTDLGFDWEADRDFANGKTGTNAAASVSVLYQSERSATADLGPVDYAIAVPNGTYDVELHLAEIFFGAPGGGPGGSGQRVFSANLEGGPAELVDYDLNDDVGTETAVVQTYRVDVSDGVLDLAMTASTNRPTIGGIAIIPADVNEPDPVVARINAGGPALTDLGVDWDADREFDGGKSYVNASATVSPLYQSERSATTNLGPFAYDIPVADGTYEVRLHLAEIYFGADGGGPGGAGQRVFSANIEGGAVELADYDINADVGPQTETVESFTVTVTDGNLDIDFTASTNQPKVSAIEVLASN